MTAHAVSMKMTVENQGPEGTKLNDFNFVKWLSLSPMCVLVIFQPMPRPSLPVPSLTWSSSWTGMTSLR